MANSTSMKNIHQPLLLLGILVLLSTSSIQAQSIAPQSVNTAGAKMTQANGSLNFTVGELVVLTFSDSDGNTLGGGFTSGSTTSAISTASILEPDPQWLHVKVYPNPTSGLLTVAVQEMKIPQLTLEVYDVNGKIVMTKKHTDATSNDITINTSSWVSGIYFLNLKNNNQVIGTYKIIKE